MNFTTFYPYMFGKDDILVMHTPWLGNAAKKKKKLNAAQGAKPICFPSSYLHIFELSKYIH